MEGSGGVGGSHAVVFLWQPAEQNSQTNLSYSI